MTAWFGRHSPGGSMILGPRMMYWCPPPLVDVVVLHEHRRRENHVGDLGRLGHELLVHADEEVLARESLVDESELRCDHHRVRVLNEHCGDRGTVPEGRAGHR